MLPLRFQIVVIVVIGFLALSVTREVSAESLDEIIAQWNKRQSTVTGLRVTWKELRTEARGARHGGLGAKPRGGLQPGKFVPEREMTFDAGVRFVADEGRMRVDESSTQYSAKTQQYERFTQISSYDGKVLKTLQLSREKPYGRLCPEQYNTEVIMTYMRPILLFYRPLDGRSGVDVEISSLTGKEELDGRQCALVTEVEEMRRVTYWVDLKRDFHIIRVLHENRGARLSQIDISYKLDPQRNWVPESWTITRFDRNGDMKTKFAGTVTEIELDPQIDDDEFALQFPVGTTVYDSRNDVNPVLDALGESIKQERRQRAKEAAQNKADSNKDEQDR